MSRRKEFFFNWHNFPLIGDDFIWPFSSCFDIFDEFKGKQVVDRGG
jgi:hypothetical protein